MSALHPAEQSARLAGQLRDAALAQEPARRKAQGVVHTPPEIARGVLAILDELLQRELGLGQGASDPSVHLIDPACGPGAFLAAALRLWDARGRPSGLRLTGLDLDASALASAAELAVHAPAEFELRCADVLREPRALEWDQAPGRVLVITGNPPWISARADKTPEMQALLEDFRCDDLGVRLPERKLGVLSDAYVRFVRVCAEAARCSAAGAVVALVTNGSFLDGPVHRGMRAALVRWFDTLHVLDLGGSALLQRTAADRLQRDDNLFGVRPSVTISWLCRRPGGGGEPRSGRVFYARLWGSAANKRSALADARLESLGFGPLSADRPLRRFVPRRAIETTYASWPSLAEWMPFHREGVQTNRDRVAIDRNRSRLLERLQAFTRGAALSELAQANVDQVHYRASVARRNVAAALEQDPDGSLGVSVRRIAYRPFDERWFCPIAPLCHRPRPELLQAIDADPRVLVGVRKDRGFSEYAHFGAADCIIDNCFLSTRSSCRARAFPVCQPDGSENLSSVWADRCAERVGEAVSAAHFQRYALAWMASGVYRRRYDVELHEDYPRLPLPRSAEEWRWLVARGEALMGLWIEPIALGQPAATEAESAAECEPVAALELRCGELRIDAAHGCILGGSRRLLEVEPAALGLWLGHVQPLKLFLLTHSEETLTADHWTMVLGLTRRMERIDAAIQQLDAWVRESGAV